MINYLFEEQIYKVAFTEKVDFKEVLDFLKEFYTNKSLPDKVYVLYDLRTANFKFTLNEIRLISKLAEHSTKRYKKIKTAILVKNPKLTAYTMLFSIQSVGRKTQRKIFSTKDAAIKWLLINKI